MSVHDFAELLEESETEEIIEYMFGPLDRIEGEEWQERTADMLAAVIPALIFEKEHDDNEDAGFTAENLRETFGFANVLRISHLEDLPEELSENLSDYMNDLGSDAHEAEEQHEQLVALFFTALEQG